MQAVIIAVVADLAVVAGAVLGWQLFGDRIREFVEERDLSTFLRH
jgi:hypothetical protein